MPTAEEQLLVAIKDGIDATSKKVLFLELLHESRNVIHRNQQYQIEILEQNALESRLDLEIDTLDYEISSLKKLIFECDSSALIHTEVEYDESFVPNDGNGDTNMKEKLEQELILRKHLATELDSKKNEFKSTDRSLRAKVALIEKSIKEVGEVRAYAEKALI